MLTIILTAAAVFACFIGYCVLIAGAREEEAYQKLLDRLEKEYPR